MLTQTLCRFAPRRHRVYRLISSLAAVRFEIYRVEGGLIYLNLHEHPMMVQMTRTGRQCWPAAPLQTVNRSDDRAADLSLCVARAFIRALRCFVGGILGGSRLCNRLIGLIDLILRRAVALELVALLRR